MKFPPPRLRMPVREHSGTGKQQVKPNCGISVELHRFSFGTRNENQFRVAFAVSNIGTFGTLRKQDRLF